MNNPPSKKANVYLENSERDLQTVFAKIKVIADLHTKVMPYIDAALRNQCQVANAYQNRLILIAANGSVATQIRFQSMDLLRKFKQDPLLAHFQEIVCKVRPAPSTSSTARRKQHKMETLTSETASIVQQIADSIEDPDLRGIMQKIASRKK